MSDLAAMIADLKAPAAPDPETALIIELVFEHPRTHADVSSKISRVLGGARAELKEIFSPAGQPDRYFFLTLPDADPAGREVDVFEFARVLAVVLGAQEANPCFQDGLTYAHGLDSAELNALAHEVFRTDAIEDHTGWAPECLDTEAAWALTQGENVKVGQIDTGYSSHVELNEIYELNDQLNLIETNTPTDASDRFSRNVWFPHPGHGTYGASVMTSRGGLTGDEATAPGRITGVAPACRIVPIRAIRSVIDLNQKRIPCAIRHAVRSGCDVITMCLGGITHWASVQQAMHDAVEEGVIIVCAAGNVWPAVVYPAAFSADRLCVAVAAVDQNLKPWTWTARGSAVTVSAPGKNVWAARKNSRTDDDVRIDRCNGTTLACSLTSGVAALFVARNGGRRQLREVALKAGLTVQELFMRAIVYNLTPPPVWHGAGDLGAGVVDARSVLAFDPGSARLPAVLARGETAVRDFVPAIAILRRLVGAKSEVAALEADKPIEPYAQELIWQFHVRGAQERIKKLGPQFGAKELASKVFQTATSSDELSRLLSERVHLANAIGI